MSIHGFPPITIFSKEIQSQRELFPMNYSIIEGLCQQAAAMHLICFGYGQGMSAT
jgi:hypothetical protein